MMVTDRAQSQRPPGESANLIAIAPKATSAISGSRCHGRAAIGRRQLDVCD
jgi:outer membrane receptor for monomeric catechols